MNKTRPVLIFLMKLLVSTGLIVFFLTQIHIERFLGTLASAKFSDIALALVVYWPVRIALAAGDRARALDAVERAGSSAVGSGTLVVINGPRFSSRAGAWLRRTSERRWAD